MYFNKCGELNQYLVGIDIKGRPEKSRETSLVDRMLTHSIRTGSHIREKEPTFMCEIYRRKIRKPGSNY